MSSSKLSIIFAGFLFMQLLSACSVISDNEGLENLEFPFNAETTGLLERTISGADFEYDTEMLIRVREDDGVTEKTLDLSLLAIKDNRGEQEDGLLFEVMSFRLHMEEGLPKPGIYEVGGGAGQTRADIVYLERSYDAGSGIEEEFRVDMRSASGSVEILKSGTDFMRGRFKITADMVSGRRTTTDENSGESSTVDLGQQEEAVVLSGDFQIN